MTILYAVTILHYVFIFQIIISNLNVLNIVQEYVPHNKAFVTITAIKSGKKIQYLINIKWSLFVKRIFIKHIVFCYMYQVFGDVFIVLNEARIV